MLPRIKNFAEYEALVSTTKRYPNIGSNLNYCVVALGGECGELLNKYKKVLRDNNGEVLDEPICEPCAGNGEILRKGLHESKFLICKDCEGSGIAQNAVLKEHLLDECGDILWYLTAIANELHVTLEDIANMNIIKLQSRLIRGKIKGSGDNR